MADKKDVAAEQKDAAKETEKAAKADEKAAKDQEKAAEATKDAAETEKATAKSKDAKAPRERKKPAGDPALILFIITLAIFLYAQFSGPLSPTVNIVLSIVFLLYAGIFVEGGILTTAIPVAGVLWWLVFNLQVYAIIVLAVVVGVLGYLGRKDNVDEQFAAGGVLLLLFIFSSGLASHLMVKLAEMLPATIALTEALQVAVLYVPWWVLYFMVKTKKSGTLVGTLRAGIIVYLLFILITAVVPSVGFDYDVPGIDDVAKTGEQLQQEVSKSEHPLWTNLWCIWNESSDISACVKKRQEESVYAYVCAEEKNLVDTPSENDKYDECVEEERNKKAVVQVQASGVIDRRLTEFVEIELKKSKDFPAKVYQANYPLFIQLEASNPTFEDEQPIVTPSCHFVKGKNITEGTISSTESISLNQKNSKENIVCVPTSDLKSGRYKVVFQTIISNLKTTTWLNRLFVGFGKSAEEKEKLEREYFSGLLNSHLTMGPPAFARVNFLIGTPPENPLIEWNPDGDNFMLMISSVENSGKGEIVSVGQVTIDTLNDFSFDKPECITPQVPVFKGKDKIIPLSVCSASITDPLLQEPEHFVPREYEATIIYDYNLTQEVPFEVVLLNS